jgi:hypothetical protein
MCLSLVSDLEPDAKAVPVLLKHYLKLNGRLIAFNVDEGFGGCLDGLIVVDLTQTDPKLLAAYMGEDGARQLPGIPRFRRREGPGMKRADLAVPP